MRQLPYPLLLCCVCFASSQVPAAAAPRPFLSPLFTSHMVLQRGIRAPVWGWARPGTRVTVEVAGSTGTAVANPEGRWLARVGPLEAGGPHRLVVRGPETVVLTDVLVGDVWLCSGQSNMEQGIGVSKNAQAEIAAANYPRIRLYTVPKSVALVPQTNVAAEWQVCSPQTVGSGGWGGFSAAAYYFGRELHRTLKVPIGLIHSSWGGTVAEAWTSASALEAMPAFRPALANLHKAVRDREGAGAAFERLMTEWWNANDLGSVPGLGWADPDLDDSTWGEATLPGPWEAEGLPVFDGVVWYRKEVHLGDVASNKAGLISLGAIDDRDTTWVNGVKVGSTHQVNQLRRYVVPAGVLKPGRNVVAVRVLDTGGNGGFAPASGPLELQAPGVPSVSLAGPWKYRASTPLRRTQPPPEYWIGNPNYPSVLYNGMIAPLVPYGIKGAIWYQGESNAGRAYQYRKLLPLLIRDWRTRWGLGSFPFYIVQLANFTNPRAEPGDDAWAELREAQLMTAQSVPNTGLAVAIDIGEAADIHPKNKQEVGRRLALNALAKTYGRKVAYSGPIYRSMRREGRRIRLSFDHVSGRLVARGGKLKGFAIAGSDRRFVWANARIEGDQVVVWSPKVPRPAAVRYAWEMNPVCNLYNKVGLPASPFRTDSWPGITAKAQ